MATYKCKRPYMYGTGRRKHSVARVHLIPNGTGAITINGRDIDDYRVRKPAAFRYRTYRFTAAAFPVRPALSATASPEHCFSLTRTTVHLSRPQVS